MVMPELIFAVDEEIGEPDLFVGRKEELDLTGSTPLQLHIHPKRSADNSFLFQDSGNSRIETQFRQPFLSIVVKPVFCISEMRT